MIYKKKTLPSMRATRACSLLATRAWRKFLELNLYKYITERQQCAAFRKYQKRTKSLHPTAKHMPPVSARGTVCTAHLCAVFALFLGKIRTTWNILYGNNSWNKRGTQCFKAKAKSRDENLLFFLRC